MEVSDRGEVTSSPAVASDGTIYVGSKDNHLYAINKDGTQKYKFPTGGEVTSTPKIHHKSKRFYRTRAV